MSVESFNKASTERLLARLAIEELLAKYAMSVDRRDWAQYKTCFTKDARIDYTAAGGPKGGVEEVIRWFKATFYWLGEMQHLVSNLEITWLPEKPNVCKTRAMFHNPICVWWMPFIRPLFFVGGWYNHTMEKGSDGVWRISTLKEEIAYNQVYGAVAMLLASAGLGIGLLVSACRGRKTTTASSSWWQLTLTK